MTRTTPWILNSILVLIPILPLNPAMADAAVVPVTEERPELGRHFKALDAEGAFVLYDAARQTTLRYNPKRAGQRFIPASTFKIPNSLIALETGVIREGEVLAWDGKERRIRSWNKDHHLETAFQSSVVWFYQELARRIGEPRMGEYITKMGYGNQDISGGIDLFWLNRGLAISAEEQIDFLVRLEAGDLPFSAATMETVRRIMKIEQGDGYVLRGKTGWGQPDGRDGVQHGWLVGWVEKGAGRFFFALQVSSLDPGFPMYKARRTILDAILEDLKVLKH